MSLNLESVRFEIKDLEMPRLSRADLTTKIKYDQPFWISVCIWIRCAPQKSHPEEPIHLEDQSFV